MDFEEVECENEDEIQLARDNTRKKSEIKNLYYAYVYMISKCRHYINVSCALCKWLNVEIEAGDKV
jgi:hypothetical protein